MQRYTKTNWVVDVTKVNPTNMNKIENQLETLTDEVIDIETDMPTVPTKLSDFTDDLGSSPIHTHNQYLTQHQDISGKLDTSKVKNVNSTTVGDVYDVRYINTMIGDIESLLGGI